MNDLNIEDLKRLLLDGRQAAQYAFDHYEELAVREPVYTLYGPYAYGTGAAIPGKFIPKCARNLTFKTRRKKYIIYELDNNYNLLRARQVFNSVNDNTYQCFELDGIQYACPFRHNRKQMSRDEVLALSWKDGKPEYFAFLTHNTLIAQFFEHVSQDKMLVTAYTYNPVSEYTLQGQLTVPDAPLGQPNSPAARGSWEEAAAYTDFSMWFKQMDENSELQKSDSP